MNCIIFWSTNLRPLKLRPRQADKMRLLFVFIFHSPIQDLGQQYRSDRLTNGVFTCAIKGVYFFSYHMSAKSRVSVLVHSHWIDLQLEVKYSPFSPVIECYLRVSVCSTPDLPDAYEGHQRSYDTVRHSWGFPGHLWLGSPGAGGRRHSVSGGVQKQQHYGEPTQHEPHPHRLPHLPHSLKHASLLYIIWALGGCYCTSMKCEYQWKHQQNWVYIGWVYSPSAAEKNHLCLHISADYQQWI